jgi:hypothetical protein
VHSVCKKGVRKQYRRIKALNKMDSGKGLNVSDLDALQQLPQCDEKLRIVTVNGRGLRTKLMLMRKIAKGKPDIKLLSGPSITLLLAQQCRDGCQSCFKDTGGDALAYQTSEARQGCCLQSMLIY